MDNQDIHNRCFSIYFSLSFSCTLVSITFSSVHRSQTYLSPTPSFSFWIWSLAPYWHGWLCSQQSSRPASQLGRQPLMASYPHNGSVQLHFLHARWVSVETQSGWWLTTTFSPYSPPISLPFFQRNGANVQPCGQLTGRLGPYANFMMAEPVVSSARCRNNVSFGAALILTLISAELLMINRVRVCF